MIINKLSKTNIQILNDLLSHTQWNCGCLEWKGGLATDGYPRMLFKGNSNTKVHRLVAYLCTNKDLTGMVIRHTCDNPKCINPSHLLIGTHMQNMEDRNIRGRVPKKITIQIITAVLALLSTNQFTHKQIAEIMKIDERRVSDINCGRYCSTTGRLLRYG